VNEHVRTVQGYRLVTTAVCIIKLHSTKKNSQHYHKTQRKLHGTNYRDEQGRPSVFLLPDSKNLCDPNHEKFINRDTSKFLQVTKL
jgi:hypothetical protein